MHKKTQETDLLKWERGQEMLQWGQEEGKGHRGNGDES